MSSTYPIQAPFVLTCAVTGNLTTREQTPFLPVTPAEIAASALEAAKAGAAVVHLHVRDPESGKPSMAIAHYKETVDRIRDANPDLILNITTGPGGRFVPSQDDPSVAGPGTTLLPPEQRVEHIGILRPEICTLDLNTMNSGSAVVINTPVNVRKMAAIIRESGARPEIELFDSGDIAMLADLVKDGTIDPAPLCSLVTGVRYGFQPSPETILYARGELPAGSIWGAFGIGRFAFTTVAQSLLAGGHVRIGLEDTIHLDKGVLAKSNAELVTKARRIVEDLGGQLASPAEARKALRLA
ncbi:3-keto-5-aminohexanoate cleavage protein [Sphingobium sp. 15-1]|uniref:3-keto-5-aminohexanoate cleavage protein n=1 Tax=Sphingobium sp. 15-1 TaxID=2729616 RepID=UPI003510B361